MNNQVNNNIKIMIPGSDYTTFDPESIIVKPDDKKKDATDAAKAFLEVINNEISKKDSLYIINRNRDGDIWNESTGLTFYDKNMNIFGGIIGTIKKRNYEYNNQKYDISISIRSRFDSEDNNYFMAEMIRTYFECYHDIALTSDEIPLNDDDIFEFLKICIFRKKILKAYECGFYKKYTYFQNNDSHLRGRIDVARHICQNMGLNNGRVAYEYRECTVDNPINHLVIRTYDELKKEFPDMTDCILGQEDENGISAANLIRDLRYMAPNYGNVSLENVIQNARIPVTSVFFQEYEELRQSCIEILRGLELSIFLDDQDSDEEVDSMLFYVPDLWEVYIGSMLKGLCDELHYEYLPQEKVPPLKKRMEENGKIILKNIGEKRSLRPDFVIKNIDGKVDMLFDAKFKPGWSKFEKEIDNPNATIMDDIRTILAYATLEETSNIGVLFPEKGDGEGNKEFNEYYIGNSKKGRLYACGLEIPSVSGKIFNDWQKAIHVNLDILKERIKYILRQIANEVA